MSSPDPIPACVPTSCPKRRAATYGDLRQWANLKCMAWLNVLPVDRCSLVSAAEIARATVITVLKQIAERVAQGETVTFRPTGNSMVPLIHSRDEVVVAPVDPHLIEVGDIVLTRVAGSVYIHLVKAIEPAKRRVQIGNNRGGINGWTGFDRVYGIAVSVAGSNRPGALAKVAQQGS
jgi:hypothetical protein